jgi:hypothetical protein
MRRMGHLQPGLKQLMLTGLPVFLREEEYPFLLASPAARARRRGG